MDRSDTEARKLLKEFEKFQTKAAQGLQQFMIAIQTGLILATLLFGIINDSLNGLAWVNLVGSVFVTIVGLVGLKRMVGRTVSPEVRPPWIVAQLSPYILSVSLVLAGTSAGMSIVG